MNKRRLRRILEQASYRRPISVVEHRVFQRGYTYPVCPRCKRSMDREFTSFCNNCGQCLSWEEYSDSP